jgi:hypothetical protein
VQRYFAISFTTVVFSRDRAVDVYQRYQLKSERRYLEVQPRTIAYGPARYIWVAVPQILNREIKRTGGASIMYQAMNADNWKGNVQRGPSLVFLQRIRNSETWQGFPFLI